jgi:hypothetical protein
LPLSTTAVLRGVASGAISSHGGRANTLPSVGRSDVSMSSTVLSIVVAVENPPPSLEYS